MSEKDNQQKTNKWIFIGILIISILLPFIIFEGVYWINRNEIPVYAKKDVLAYYGSICGACFTALITAGGLYLTLSQNYEQLVGQRKFDIQQIKEQRKFDINQMEEQKKQFYKDYSLKLMKQKLDTYKEIYLLIEKIINKCIYIEGQYEKCRYIEEEYESRVTQKKIDISIDDIKNHAESIFEIHNEFIFMKIFITENSLISKCDQVTSSVLKLKLIVDKCDSVPKEFNFNEYVNCYEEIRKSYLIVSTELRKVSKDIYIKEMNNDMI